MQSDKRIMERVESQMQSFSYYSPTKVLFGKDAEAQVAAQIQEFGGSRVLIVYGGGSVVRSGLLARVEATLERAGLASALYGGVQPNPSLQNALDGTEKARAFQADFILGVGGGSVIDCAKAIAHGTANPDTPLWSFWDGTPLTKSIPVGTILTISAAGSECSNSSVLTDTDTGSKRGLGSDWNRPKFAIMNPELTYTLPDFQIACGIADIMMHTMDRYFTSTLGNRLSDEFAEGLLRVVIASGKVAMKNHSDYDAMSELMWCGSMSHNDLTGLGGVKDFAPHQLGHAISGRYNIAHGASLTTVWDAWARHVVHTNPARFAQFGRNVWGITESDTEKCALAAIEATVAFFSEIGMPVSFSQLAQGVQSEEMLIELTDMCMYHGARSSIGSFQQLGRNDVYEIYRASNH